MFLLHVTRLLIVIFLVQCIMGYSFTAKRHIVSTLRPLFKHDRFNSGFVLYSTKSEDLTSEKDLLMDNNALVIPTHLPSACNIDYVPLATMLATGDFLAADQFTRDNLIEISGAAAAGRQFVYWTEVKSIPSIDLATMELLWLKFSEGKFGFSVQKRIWDQENGDFDRFISRVGWTTTSLEGTGGGSGGGYNSRDEKTSGSSSSSGGSSSGGASRENGGYVDPSNVRKLKWFGKNEFVYDLNKAVRGHLPLTNALRGTQLLRQLMVHPVWDEYDWKNYNEVTLV